MSRISFKRTLIKKIVQLLLLLTAVIALLSCRKNEKAVATDFDQVYFRKADSIISWMTLKEKVGQMLNIGLPALLEGEFYTMRDTLIFDTSKVNRLLVDYGAGCVQNLGNYPLTPQQWKYYIGYIQNIIKEKTRLKIPVIYGIDAVHGANYTAGSILFPHQINLGATFEPEWAFMVGKVTAYEVKYGDILWNYSPNLDIASHPNWGRIFETFGEDTYLTQQMGLAMLNGLQGEDPSAADKVVACGKHFLGYGASLNGKDRAPVVLSEAILRQVHLPPFKKAIEDGLLSIMLSGSSLNGVPSHADEWLITRLLKEELGFKGVVLGDWGEIDILYRIHKVAENEQEAIKIAVLAGIDMIMEPYDGSFVEHLVDLVENGEVPMSRIDDAVRRIIFLKYKSGIMNESSTLSDYYSEFNSLEHNRLNLHIARESITLLKNEKQILPLNKNQSVLLTGLAANTMIHLNGGWSRTWAGDDPSYDDPGKYTVLQAIQNEIGDSKVVFSQGTGYSEEVNIEDVVREASGVDVIIACLGEKPASEKFNDIEELELPEIQIKLVEELSRTGKPIILVLLEGRPRIIREIEPLVDAIVLAYLPGNEGGQAISDVMYGNFNPCGKLPFTYPRFSGSLWKYDHTLSEERNMGFEPNGFNPQYEFGFGLSYTEFVYEDLQISSDTIISGTEMNVTIRVTNSGNRTGKETVLLFISDEIASVTPAVKQLKRFKKIELTPGESREINFKIQLEDLQFVNKDNKWIAEEGFFTIHVGDKNTRFYLDTK